MEQASPKDTTEAPHPQPAARSELAHWLLVAAIALSSLVLRGYRHHGQDNDVWIPAIASLMDAELHPDDPGVHSHQRDLSPYPAIMAVVARPLGIPWTFFLLQLAARLTIFFAVAAIAARIGGKTTAILAVTLLTFPNPIAHTGVLSVEDQLLPRSIGMALGLSAVAAAWGGRHVLAGAALAAVIVLHPPSAIGPAIATLVVTLHAETGRWRGVLIIAGIASLAALPVGLKVWSLSAPSDPLWSAEERWELLRRFHGGGLLDGWASWHWLRLLPGAVAFLLPACLPDRVQSKALRTALLAGAVVVACSLLGALVGQELRLTFIVRVIPIRGIVLAVLLAHVHLALVTRWALGAGRWQAAIGAASFLCFLAGFWGCALLLTILQPLALARRVRGGRRLLALGIALVTSLITCTVGAEFLLANLRLHPERALLVLAAMGAGALFAARDLVTRPRAVTASAFVIIAVLCLWRGGPARIDWPWTETESQWTEVARWADRATPKSALFAVVPVSRGFRAQVRRSVVVEVIDSNTMAWTDEGTREFMRRSEAVRPRPLPELLRELDAFGVDYLVVPSAGGKLPLPRVHADTLWSVYEIPEARGHASSPTDDR